MSSRIFSSGNCRFQWRFDSDGFLKITARILKEGVYPYARAELEEAAAPAQNRPDASGHGASGHSASCLSASVHSPSAPGRASCAAAPAFASEQLPDPVLQYIPAAAFTPAALASLEGKDVTIPRPGSGQWHEWRTPGNSGRDRLSVGSISGRPRLSSDGRAIECDMLIKDAEAIRAITAETDPALRLVEVSAGYEGEFTLRPGVWQGQPYHGVQQNLRFNHVLLLPAGMGRCGADVRIINSNPRGNQIMNQNPEALSTPAGLPEPGPAAPVTQTETAAQTAAQPGPETLNRLAALIPLLENLPGQIEQLKAELAQTAACLAALAGPAAAPGSPENGPGNPANNPAPGAFTNEYNPFNPADPRIPMGNRINPQLRSHPSLATPRQRMLAPMRKK